MYEINRLRRQRLAQQRKAIDDELGGYTPPSAITLDSIMNETRGKYTQEDNYKAFKLFSIMDVDHSGSISLREVNRMLLGDMSSTFLVRFDHPDTGIVWGIDIDDCLIVESIEPNSPASLIPQIIHGLRLVRVNDHYFMPHDRNALRDLLQYLLQLHDAPLELEILEPLIILTPFSHVLDMKIENEIFCIELPVGALYNLEIFKSIVQTYLIKTDPIFQFMAVGVIKKRRQIFFQCEKYKFRLLFSTGPNYHRSCRFALGFAAEDYQASNYIIGQSMAINLDLGLSQQQLEILTKEIFDRFDRNKVGYLSFEEFRDFYVRFLDNEDCIEVLKAYARYRFRNLELESWWYQKMEQKRDRLDRKRLSRERSRDILQRQKTNYMDSSEVCYDGIRRVKKTAAALADANLAIRSRMLPTIEEANDSQSEFDLNEEDDDKTISTFYDSTTEYDHDHITKHHFNIEVRNKQKKIQRLQHRRRKQRLIRQLVEKKKQEDQMRDNRDPDMTEIEMALSIGSSNAIKISTNPENRMQNIHIGFRDIIAAPGFQVTPSLFQNVRVNPADIILEELDASALHPAAKRYFMIKENVVAPPFDSKMRHPAFFNSNYIRHSNRNYKYSLAICKLMAKERQQGVDYRNQAGMKRSLRYPPGEHIETKRNIKFLLPSRVKNNSLVGRITIHSITLSNLMQYKQYHANSPFVQLQCSEHFSCTTGVNYNAGSYSKWDELNWAIEFHHSDVLSVCVMIGSYSNFEVILHNVFAAATDVVNFPVDSFSRKEWIVKVPRNDGMMSTSELKITFTLDEGDRWDWFIIDQVKHEAELENTKQQLRKAKFANTDLDDWLKAFRSTAQDVPEQEDSTSSLKNSEFDNPELLEFTIKVVSLFDIVHQQKRSLLDVFFKSSSLAYLVVECGSNEFKSNVFQLDTKETLLADLDWPIRIHSPRANLVILLFTKSNQVIGRFAISGEDISRRPRDNKRLFQIFGNFIHHQSGVGHITLSCEDLTNSKQLMDSRITEECPHIDFQPGKDTIVLQKRYMIQGVDIQVGDLQTFVDSMPNPIKIRMMEIQLSDIISSVPLSALIPSIHISCLEDYFSSPELSNDDADSREYRWNCLAREFQDDVNLALSLERHQHFTVIIKNKSSIIGTSQLNCLDILKAYYIGKCQFRREIQKIKITDNIFMNSDLVGTITFTILLDSTAKVRHTTASSQPRLAPSKIVTTSIQSENKFPYCVQIHSLTLSDVRQAHFFKKNSLHITMACGPWAMQSSKQQNSGTSADFTNLGIEWKFVLFQYTNVHVSVWSNEALVSQTSIEPSHFVLVPNNESGFMELIVPLSFKNVVGGKLKIRFTMEHVSRLSSALSHFPQSSLDGFTKNSNTRPMYDLSIANISTVDILSKYSVKPPIRAILHSIDVYDIPSVHKYESNEPFVKVSCENWSQSTPPLTENKDRPILSSLILQGLSNAIGAQETNNNLKWKHLNWEFTMNSGESVEFSVMSQSVVVGIKSLTAEELINIPLNIFGFTEVEDYILHNGQIRGRIKLSFYIEGIHEVNNVETENSEEQPQEIDTYSKYKASLKKNKSKIMKSNGNGNEFTIFANSEYFQELNDQIRLGDFTYEAMITSISFQLMNSLEDNHSKLSPFYCIEYHDVRIQSDAQYLTGEITSWSNLAHKITFHPKAASTLRTKISSSELPYSNSDYSSFRISLVSRNLLIGSEIVTISDIIKSITSNDSQRSYNCKLNLLMSNKSHSETDNLSFGIVEICLKLSVLEINNGLSTVETQSLQFAEDSIDTEFNEIMAASAILRPTTTDFPVKSILKSNLRPPINEVRKIISYDSNAFDCEFNNWFGNVKTRKDKAIEFKPMNMTFPYERIVQDEIRESVSDTSKTQVNRKSEIVEQTVPTGKIYDIEAVVRSQEANNAIALMEAFEHSYANYKVHSNVLIVGSTDRKCWILSIHADELRPIHKSGKNSPMLTIQSDRYKKFTNSISYAGKNCFWIDLNWELPMVRMTPLRISVTSGSANIGTTQITTQDLLDLDSNCSRDEFTQLRTSELNLEIVSKRTNTGKFLPEATLSGKLKFVIKFQDDSPCIDTAEVLNVTTSSTSIGSPSSSSTRSSSFITNSSYSTSRSDMQNESDSEYTESYVDSRPSSSWSDYSNSQYSDESQSSRRSSFASHSSSHSSEYESIDDSSDNLSSFAESDSVFSESQIVTNTSNGEDHSSFISEGGLNSKESSQYDESNEDDDDEGSDNNEDQSTEYSNEISLVHELSRPQQWLSFEEIGNPMSLIHSIAKATVTRLTYDVVQSFVALETGGDYGMMSLDSLPTLRDELFQQIYLHQHYMMSSQLSDSEIVKEVSIIAVKSIVFQACDRALWQFENSLASIKDTVNFKNRGRRQGLVATTKNVVYGIDGQPSPVKKRRIEQVLSTSYSDPRKINNIHPLDDYSVTLDDVRFHHYRPNCCKVTIHEIIGIDLSWIHPNIFPRTPYLTACKPFSNWSAETSCPWAKYYSPPKYSKHSFALRELLKPEDYILSWDNLINRFHWSSFILKLGQSIVFDLRDESCEGEIIAKCRLDFEELFMNPHNIDSEGFVSVNAVFEIAKEYLNPSLDRQSLEALTIGADALTPLPSRQVPTTDGSVPNKSRRYLKARILIQLDPSVDGHMRPKRSVDYWDQTQIQHWRVYPLTPIATGITKQMYKEISTEYDRQMIVNPVFFGYQIRWGSNRNDESKFLHPVFWNYTLNKFQLNKFVREEIDNSNQIVNKPNPYQYDKTEIICKLCRIGAEGCPRCFSIPTFYEGNRISLESFEFNPALEAKMQADARSTKLSAMTLAQAQRDLGPPDTARSSNLNHPISVSDVKTFLSKSLDDDNSSVSSISTKLIDSLTAKIQLPDIHTNLTTYKALRNFRNMKANLCTLYIKIMPTGDICKLLVDPERDSVFHVYHMFHSHTSYGSSQNPMLVLPTQNGLYELSNSMKHRTDSLLSDFSGKELLSRYGIVAEEKKSLGGGEEDLEFEAYNLYKKSKRKSKKNEQGADDLKSHKSQTSSIAKSLILSGNKTTQQKLGRESITNLSSIHGDDESNDMSTVLNFREANAKEQNQLTKYVLLYFPNYQKGYITKTLNYFLKKNYCNDLYDYVDNLPVYDVIHDDWRQVNKYQFSKPQPVVNHDLNAPGVSNGVHDDYNIGIIPNSRSQGVHTLYNDDIQSALLHLIQIQYSYQMQEKVKFYENIASQYNLTYYQRKKDMFNEKSVQYYQTLKRSRERRLVSQNRKVRSRDQQHRQSTTGSDGLRPSTGETDFSTNISDDSQDPDELIREMKEYLQEEKFKKDNMRKKRLEDKREIQKFTKDDKSLSDDSQSLDNTTTTPFYSQRSDGSFEKSEYVDSKLGQPASSLHSLDSYSLVYSNSHGLDSNRSYLSEFSARSIDSYSARSSYEDDETRTIYSASGSEYSSGSDNVSEDGDYSGGSDDEEVDDDDDESKAQESLSSQTPASIDVISLYNSVKSRAMPHAFESRKDGKILEKHYSVTSIPVTQIADMLPLEKSKYHPVVTRHLRKSSLGDTTYLNSPSMITDDLQSKYSNSQNQNSISTKTASNKKQSNKSHSMGSLRRDSNSTIATIDSDGWSESTGNHL